MNNCLVIIIVCSTYKAYFYFMYVNYMPPMYLCYYFIYIDIFNYTRSLTEARKIVNRGCLL